MSVEGKRALVRRSIEEHNRRNHLAIDEALIAGQASRSDQAGARTPRSSTLRLTCPRAHVGIATDQAALLQDLVSPACR
jgi:hypothetical protein